MSAPICRLDALRRHIEASTSSAIECDGIGAVPTAAAASKFKYTLDLDVPVLTPEQRAFYEENGYIVFRKLVPEADLEMYRQRFNALCDGDVPRPPMMTVMRDGACACSRASALLDNLI